MANVTVLPANLEFEAALGETIMDAAHAHGLYWPTTCGGQGICTTCLCEVVSGAESLASMGRHETKTLTAERGAAILQRPMRLACQAAICGVDPIVLTKAGVRPTDV
jgi:ferredoxin, 2Fe-2S